MLIGPFIWQELMELICGVVADSCDDIFEVFEGVDVVAFCGLDDCEEDGCCFAAFIAAEEHPIFSSNSDWPHQLFGKIIID